MSVQLSKLLEDMSNILALKKEENQVRRFSDWPRLITEIFREFPQAKEHEFGIIIQDNRYPKVSLQLVPVGTSDVLVYWIPQWLAVPEHVIERKLHKAIVQSAIGDLSAELIKREMLKLSVRLVDLM